MSKSFDNIYDIAELPKLLYGNNNQLNQFYLINTIIYHINKEYGEYDKILIILFSNICYHHKYPIVYNWLVNDWEIDEKTVDILQYNKLIYYIIGMDHKNDLTNKLIDSGAIFSESDLLMLCNVTKIDCILNFIKKNDINNKFIQIILKLINDVDIFIVNNNTFNYIVEILNLLYINNSNYCYDEFINNLKRTINIKGPYYNSYLSLGSYPPMWDTNPYCINNPRYLQITEILI